MWFGAGAITKVRRLQMGPDGTGELHATGATYYVVYCMYHLKKVDNSEDQFNAVINICAYNYI